MKKRNIWLLRLQQMDATSTTRIPYVVYVISSHTTEREVLQEAKANKFNPAWWDCYLVLQVLKMGEVWLDSTI